MSATSVGQIGLDLVVNQKQFNKQMTGVQSLAKKAGKALAAAFAVTKVVEFGKACIDLGSDLEEVQNVVNVTFPTMQAKVDAFAKDAASSFGLSETMAKKYTSTLGSMAKAFGFTEGQAYDMGSTLAGLAGDVASFYNLSQDEAYTKLKSVFTGETESLKELGVVMTQTALDSFAMANGFNKTVSAMSEAEKVALRYAFVQDKLSAAQGDFARTSDSWANQVKVMNLQFESLKATIGQGLIAAFTPVLQLLNRLLAKVQVLATSFKDMMEGMFGAQTEATAFTSAANAAEATADSTAATAENLKKSSKFLAGFDTINKLSKDNSSGSSGASGISIPSTPIIPKVEVPDNALSPFVKKISDAIMPVLNTIGSVGQLLFNNILAPLGTWVVEDALPSFFDTLSGVFQVLEPLLVSLQPLLTWLWDNFLSPIASWTGGVITTVLDTLSGLLSDIGTWMSDNQSVVDAITTSFVAFFAAWKLTELFAFIQMSGGIVTAITSMTTALWSNISAKIVDKAETMYIMALYAKDFVMSIVSGTAALISQAAQWAVTTGLKIADTAATVASTVATGAATAATWAFNAALVVLTSPITLVIAAVAALIAGIVLLVKNFDTVKEVAGKVFSAIGDIAKKAINGILGGIESFINGVINGFNFMIKALNKLSFDVPNWVPVIGGKKFGFNLKEVKSVSIPRLAEGGFVKKNTPQLAMIGDNRHQGEVVAPEDKLREMAIQAVRAAGSGGITKDELEKIVNNAVLRIVSALYELGFNLDGEQVAKAERIVRQGMDRRFNTVEIG